MERRVVNRRVRCLQRAVIGERETEGGRPWADRWGAWVAEVGALGAFLFTTFDPGTREACSRTRHAWPSGRQNRGGAGRGGGGSRYDSGSLCRLGRRGSRGTSSGGRGRGTSGRALTGPVPSSHPSMIPRRRTFSGGGGGKSRLTKH